MELIVNCPIFAEMACELVNQASFFEEEILIKKGHQTVDARSLLGVLSLALDKGSRITITANPSSVLVSFLAAVENKGLFQIPKEEIQIKPI